MKWFKYLCNAESLDPKQAFFEMVPIYFRGILKPPFNKEARSAAGMTEDWYLPLSVRTTPLPSEQKTILSKKHKQKTVENNDNQ